MGQYKQHHMSKSELKADKMLQSFINLRHFLHENKKNLWRGIAVLAVLLVVVIMLFNKKAEKEAKAMQAFEKAYSVLSSGDLNKKINKVDGLLKKVIRSYPGTYAAAKAQYYVGHIQYQLGNFNASLNGFKKASAYGSGTHLYPMSLLAQGNAYEQLGKYADAIRAYRKVIRKAPNSGFTSTAKMWTARCLIGLKKIAEAKKLLQEIKLSRSIWANDAKRWDAFLGIMLRKSYSK